MASGFEPKVVTSLDKNRTCTGTCTDSRTDRGTAAAAGNCTDKSTEDSPDTCTSCRTRASAFRQRLYALYAAINRQLVALFGVTRGEFQIPDSRFQIPISSFIHYPSAFTQDTLPTGRVSASADANGIPNSRFQIPNSAFRIRR